MDSTGNVVAGGGTSDINLSLTSSSLPTPIVDFIDFNGLFSWSFKLTETSPDYQWVASIKFNPAATKIAAVLDKSLSQPLLMLIIDPSVGSIISQYTEPASSNSGYIGPNSLVFDSLGNVYLAL